MPLSSSASRFAPSTLSKLEPSVHAVVKEMLGFSEPKVLQATMDAVQAGGDTEDIKTRLAELMERRKASKLAVKISATVNDFCVAHDLPTMEENSKGGNRKRRADGDEQQVPAKTVKKEEEGAAAEASGGGGFQAMTPDQIREIMAKTKREIAQRIMQLSATQENNQAKIVGPQKPADPAPPAPAAPAAAATDDKAQTLAALQARIAANLSKMQDKLPVPSR